MLNSFRVKQISPLKVKKQEQNRRVQNTARNRIAFFKVAEKAGKTSASAFWVNIAVVIVLHMSTRAISWIYVWC